MPTVKKALAGMGLSSFLIMATVVAGAISTFMFRAHQLNRERLVEDLVYAKSMLRTHLKAVLADDQICGQVLNPGDPSVTVDTFDFRLGSSHGLLQVTDLTFTSTGAPGEFALAWELTQRNGLPTARKMRDSLTLQYTAATGGTPATCHLVGAPPAATNNWGSTKGQMCAKLTRFPTTPTTAALADCSFSSILAGDFPTGPTRWTLESQGVPLLGGDTMAAVRAGALSNLLVPDGSGNLPACGPGDAVYNITKPAGASPLSLECESLTGGGGLCTSPCTGAASACCLDSGPNAILYQDGVVQSSTPGGCALNFPTTAACDPSPQLGSGPGCVGPTFFCPASAPSCSAPSPCLSCCRNEGGGHRNYAGGVPVTGVLPGVCGGSPRAVRIGPGRSPCGMRSGSELLLWDGGLHADPPNNSERSLPTLCGGNRPWPECSDLFWRVRGLRASRAPGNVLRHYRGPEQHLSDLSPGDYAASLLDEQRLLLQQSTLKLGIEFSQVCGQDDIPTRALNGLLRTNVPMPRPLDGIRRPALLPLGC